MKCEMIKPHHPDCECAVCERLEDEGCFGEVVGVVEDSDTHVYVECAHALEDEGFTVIYDAGSRS